MVERAGQPLTAPSDWSKAETLTDLIDFVERVQTPEGGLITFRGERDWRWKTLPGIMRAGNDRLLQAERDAVRELIAVRPEDFQHDGSAFDRLVRMQHFGLPTRLLDVTANPLVALYCAVEKTERQDADGRVLVFKVPLYRKKYYDSDTVSLISNLSNLSEDERNVIRRNATIERSKFNEIESVDRLLQFVRAEKPYFRANVLASDLFEFRYVVPKLSNPRIIAQRGAFIAFGLSTVTYNSAPLITAHSLIIPSDKKAGIKKQLDRLGINRSGLFPEIEKAASHVMERYK